MVKSKSVFICQQCGANHLKWQGQCEECGQWNTLVETELKASRTSKKAVKNGLKPVSLTQVKSRGSRRRKSQISELDRVLGGGIVSGSLILIAGEPGIGKSTLLTQLALKLTKKDKDKAPLQVIYVCGEESPAQVKLRVKRLLKSRAKKKLKDYRSLTLLPETNVESILTSLAKAVTKTGSLVIVDSIQSLWTERLTGAAGSVGQVRHCSNMLLDFAKKTNVPIILVGHVTKEGSIAGPKVLEHLVDTVLNLEGDQKYDFRILRTNKNRFGPTDEVGVFSMTDKGLEEVKDPAKIFVSAQKGSGRAVTVVMQGVRPMLIEIQALVVPSKLAVPRRVAAGINFKRLQVLCAVIQKRLRLPIGNRDVFVSVTGGLNLQEPGADLAVALSIVSSFKNQPLPEKSVCLGEVGLLGEIRPVAFIKRRVKEAKKLGYETIIGEKESTLKSALGFFK